MERFHADLHLVNLKKVKEKTIKNKEAAEI